MDGAVGVGPEVEVFEVDVCARHVGAQDLDRSASRGHDGAGPVAEGQVLQGDAGAGAGGLGGPGAVDVEGVGVGVADEVCEGAVFDGAGAAV